MNTVIDALNSGDRLAAHFAFYGPIHNFTHNIDPDLRSVDEEKAQLLCEAVLDLEDALERSSDSLAATDATRVRDLLREAAQILGYD